jgi:undecaprenyl-diphosphatase
MNSWVIFAGSYLIFIVALIAIIVTLFSTKTVRNRIILLAMLSSLLAFGLAWIGGSLYYDTRPFVIDHSTPLINHAADNGFPSDHAVYATVVAASIFIFKRKIGILLGILAVLIGWARVVAGIHHPVDIAGGVIIGLVASSMGWLITRVFVRFKALEAWLGYRVNQ